MRAVTDADVFGDFVLGQVQRKGVRARERDQGGGELPDHVVAELLVRSN